MEYRNVTVELLRAGPRNNQLISPLTQYFGFCNNSLARQVSLPFEHNKFLLQLQELRYCVFDPNDRTRSAKVLEEIGKDIAKILKAIPDVSHRVNAKGRQAGTMTHLRIVSSASELEMLPFEASKDPSSDGSLTAWLALRSRSPACITRRLRSVSTEGIIWPNKPRILFIAGPDTDRPLKEHKRVISNVIKPWCKRIDHTTEYLMSLKTPSLAEIATELHEAVHANQTFTHVHILAHGELSDENDPYSSVGLYLNDDEGVITGERLARTLTVRTDEEDIRPVVVTITSCDSGRVSDVRTTEASVAHHLHEWGIPLVVASQFPLSEEGSVLFAEEFYRRQFWGEEPLASLTEVRLLLHSRLEPDTHDWASMVVYEALPSNLPSQLEELRYWQARRALEVVLNKLEDLTDDIQNGISPWDFETRFEDALKEVDKVSKLLPMTGPRAFDGNGLRAASNKRIAIAAFALAKAPDVEDQYRENRLSESHRRMETARDQYWSTAKFFIRPSREPVQMSGNLHWILTQVISLDVVLGRPITNTTRDAARFAAEIDLDNADKPNRAWAHASLSELSLLSLSDPELSAYERRRYSEVSLVHASRFLELVGHKSEYALPLARQFQRYVEWWGNPDLLDGFLVLKRPHWHLKCGLMPTAREIIQLLHGPNKPRLRTIIAPKDKVSVKTDSSPVAPEPDKKPIVSQTSLKGKDYNSILSLEMLPANNGDCFWIEYGTPAHPRRVLIDCGAESTSSALGKRIQELNASEEAKFELFVLTHIDSDHITGAIPLFADPKVSSQFKDIWFNGWRQVSPFLSIGQGEKFSALLANPNLQLPWNRAVTDNAAKYPDPIVLPSDGTPWTVTLPGGLNLTLLSPGPKQLKSLGRNWQAALLELEPKKALLGRKRKPSPVTDFDTFDVESLARKISKKDSSVPNGSSIALLLEFEGRSMLLTGDAHADVLTRSIKSLQRARGKEGEKLKLDAFKLSHHGSASGTTVELLDLLDCNRFLVSGNGNIFYHPDREAIARVILHGGENPTICFNYRTAFNELWDESVLKKRYKYRTIYPSKRSNGLRVLL